MEAPQRLQRSRQIYEEANKSMRSCEEKEERLMLMEAWRDLEAAFGSDEDLERVSKLLPEKVKKRRKLTAEDGVGARRRRRVSLLSLGVQSGRGLSCDLTLIHSRLGTLTIDLAGGTRLIKEKLASKRFSEWSTWP